MGQNKREKEPNPKIMEQRINALLDRAQKGDSSAVKELRPIFDAIPELWEDAGNLAAQAERSMISMVAGENPLTAEAMRRKVQNLRKELCGPEPTALERLLVERIALCWLQVHYADAAYAQRARTLSREWGEYYQRRQDRAQRRYLEAIRALAQVRRLLTPSMQVNIGNQQVNMAG